MQHRELRMRCRTRKAQATSCRFVADSFNIFGPRDNSFPVISDKTGNHNFKQQDSPMCRYTPKHDSYYDQALLASRLVLRRPYLRLQSDWLPSGDEMFGTRHALRFLSCQGLCVACRDIPSAAVVLVLLLSAYALVCKVSRWTRLFHGETVPLRHLSLPPP